MPGRHPLRSRRRGVGGAPGGGPSGKGDAARGHPRLPSLIRALCPNCREVDIAVGEARLEIVDWIQEATCRFTCPGCNGAVSKPIPPPLVQVLIKMGVPYDHPCQMPPAPPPPLTPSDLERFLRDLSTFEA